MRAWVGLRFLIERDLESGALLSLLEDFPVATFWIKALVPGRKLNKPAVRELLAFLKKHLKMC
jgi:DNA-binding transcriptional LysR family regulator